MGSFLSASWSGKKFKLDRKGYVMHSGTSGFWMGTPSWARLLMGVRGMKRREQAAVCAIHCPNIS